MKLSDLALGAIGVLVTGPKTSAEIAGLLNVDRRSVSTLMPWLRGHGIVSDGSESTPVERGGQLVGIAHSDPPRPIRWTLQPREEWREVEVG